MDAVVAYDLSKRYGEREALSGLNLQILEGGVYACVGGEGAGKTTLVRLLSGLCRPTAGECTVMGCSPFVEPAKLHALVGTVLDTACLYGHMTLSENLHFFAAVNGVEENDAVERASFLMHKLGIWEGREERADRLPTGALRRASLARALMHRPRVVLLDEPAEGLDQETMDSIRELVAYLSAEEGVSVLLCTRNLDFAQTMCDGFALLQGGRVAAKGNLKSLRKASGLLDRAFFQLAEGSAPPPPDFILSNGFWQKELKQEEDMPMLISKLVSAGCRLNEAKILKPTLQEIYNAYLYGTGRKEGELIGEEDTGRGSATPPCSAAFQKPEGDGSGAAEPGPEPGANPEVQLQPGAGEEEI